MKAIVYARTTTSFGIPVEIPDGMDPEEARDAAIEAAYERGKPTLCAQCSGWGKGWSRDEGEEMDIDEVVWEDQP